MIDKFGLVVQTDGDGGDCPCRCGVVIGFKTMSNCHLPDSLIAATQKYLKPLTGMNSEIYIRHPVRWNDPKDFSRDQGSRLMLGYGIAGRKDLVAGYYKLLVKNWFRHQNNDLLGTGEPGNIIRSLHIWYLYPLLVLLDLKFLWDVLVGWRLNPWDADNLFIMDLWWASNRYWTPTAWLAAKLYDKDAAQLRMFKNLGSASINGCAEAFQANIWFFEDL